MSILYILSPLPLNLILSQTLPIINGTTIYYLLAQSKISGIIYYFPSSDPEQFSIGFNYKIYPELDHFSPQLCNHSSPSLHLPSGENGLCLWISLLDSPFALTWSSLHGAARGILQKCKLHRNCLAYNFHNALSIMPRLLCDLLPVYLSDFISCHTFIAPTVLAMPNWSLHSLWTAPFTWNIFLPQILFVWFF